MTGSYAERIRWPCIENEPAHARLYAQRKTARRLNGKAAPLDHPISLKSYCTAESPSALFSLCLPFCCLYFKAVSPDFDLFSPCFARCKAGVLFVISNREDRNDRLCQKRSFGRKKSKSNRLALFHFYIVELAFTPPGAALSAPCADRTARHSSQRSP